MVGAPLSPCMGQPPDQPDNAAMVWIRVPGVEGESGCGWGGAFQCLEYSDLLYRT